MTEFGGFYAKLTFSTQNNCLKEPQLTVPRHHIFVSLHDDLLQHEVDIVTNNFFHSWLCQSVPVFVVYPPNHVKLSIKTFLLKSMMSSMYVFSQLCWDLDIFHPVKTPTGRLWLCSSWGSSCFLEMEWFGNTFTHTIHCEGEHVFLTQFFNFFHVVLDNRVLLGNNVSLTLLSVKVIMEAWR